MYISGPPSSRKQNPNESSDDLAVSNSKMIKKIRKVQYPPFMNIHLMNDTQEAPSL